MSIRERENELFKRWEQVRPDLVKDGVICESTYLKSNPKILFILKEVNDKGGGKWDLREYVAAGARSDSWNNITRWVKGIINLNHDLNWSEICQISEEDRIKNLKNISVMNLKKSPGGHTSYSSTLAQAAEQDKNFISEQFGLYNPDLVICGGTGSEAEHFLGIKPAWKSTSRGINYFEFRQGKFIVSYSHPMARVGSTLLYYGLIDAVREITRKIKIIQVNRRISERKFLLIRENIDNLNKMKSDGRWYFSIKENEIVCKRTWTGTTVYELRYDIQKDGSLVLHINFSEAVVYMENLTNSISDNEIRLDVNILLDELIDRLEYC